MSHPQIPSRTLWEHPQKTPCIQIVDQRSLPHQVVVAELHTYQEAAHAIADMWVRGAPLIGATAAYGMYLACTQLPQGEDAQAFLKQAAEELLATRPTAVNLQWAIRLQLKRCEEAGFEPKACRQVCLEQARQIVEEDAEHCRQIGLHGLPLIEAIHSKTGKTVNVLTHCNAGRMACIEWGTATSPIYHAQQAGIPVHVWVDETRPRNQGARITAWELAAAGVPHTVIADNTGGHLMQHGLVDLCLVGSDRTTARGDVANKIGTYLKALAARDNEVPFYVALPSSSIDFELQDGLKEIPIEARGAKEVSHIQGWSEEEKRIQIVRLTPEASPVANFAFDVTPARLVTALITERGVCDATPQGLAQLFPEFDPA
jgi:methylthioribose-1-phosphate isomerase